MRKFEKFIDIKVMRRLFESLGVTLGYFEGISFKEQGINDEKIRANSTNDMKPGCKVKIIWKNHMSGLVDYGYVFTLPGIDCEDIYMTGIIHIPIPSGGEKGQPEPEWYTLSELVANDNVKEVHIY